MNNGTFSSIIAREELLDHARSSQYRRVLKHPTVQHEEYNSLCGDRVKIYVRIDDNKTIQDISFDGSGCIISQAASSLIAEYAHYKNVHEIVSLTQQDVERLIGGSMSPARMKCGMLPLIALKRALQNA